jgi:demethoxyubiquinone hydroxylase (CLK1/Coq7/Cat5 family)
MMRLPVTNLPHDPAPAPVPKARGGVDHVHRSFYLSLLRLNRVRPTGLQRIVLIEGSFALGVVIALADIASAWIVLILPLLVTAAVKFEDVVATALGKLSLKVDQDARSNASDTANARPTHRAA